MEWVLYLVTNLNGDASFLSIPAPSNHPLTLSGDPPGVNAGVLDHHGQRDTAKVDEEVIFDGNLEDLHQVVIVEQEDLAETNKQALEEHDVVHNMVISLVTHCDQKGPYFRDWVLIGTFLEFWVPFGSLFSFQGPYFGFQQFKAYFLSKKDRQRAFYSPLLIYIKLLTRNRTWVMVTTSERRLMLVNKLHQVKVVTSGANYRANTRLRKHQIFKGTKIKNKAASGLFEILIVYGLIA